MNIKKYISIFLSATLATTLLVGCSQKTDNSQNQNQLQLKKYQLFHQMDFQLCLLQK